MKIPCDQWETLTDGSPDLSCSEMLIASINREAPTYLDQFLAPEALAIQLNAIRDEQPADMDDAAHDRLYNAFSDDMHASHAALLHCAQAHSDVYYWAHPPGGNADIDAADRALAESVLQPPPDPDAETAANATNGTDAAELRRRIAAASKNMAVAHRVPMNTVWEDPIPDVSRLRGAAPSPPPPQRKIATCLRR